MDTNDIVSEWGEDVLERLDGQPGGVDLQRLQTVLLIEDSQDLSRALALRLQTSGLNVECAYDGLSGLNQVETVDPDVILLDLRLPGLHGFKLLHAIKHHEGVGDAPIIVLTGDPDPEIEAKAARRGVRRVFRKPVSFRDVEKEVFDALDGL